ncbi:MULTISPECIES: hypothetical protein [unclassified Streptomyces]|uniref:hypothetical protein n=1 Tax=unclassified Streptomyces TaxID=2593676 RepID=UPI0037FBC793
MSVSTYREERRADQAATAEQRRLDAAAAEERRAERRRAEDERAARLRDQARTDRETDRAARQMRRRERAERRREVLTPAEIYRRGTLAVVTASGLASLPAQVMHFVTISPMLLPLPLALEGLAWVMAAGVAYADARHLPGWVRWLLRSLIAASAGFAASINYGYGLSLTAEGLSAADARAVGLGLAAVTLLGPIAFEIRQWVSTLDAATGTVDPDRRRHSGRRSRHHRKVVRIADRLVSAAPFGDLDRQEAFARAWSIVHGSPEPGMTPRLHKRATKSADKMHKASTRKDAGPADERSTADIVVSTPAPADQSNTPPPEAESVPTRAKVDLTKHTATPTLPVDLVQPVSIAPDRAAAADSTRPRRVTGKVPTAARTPRPKRTFEQLLAEARSVTADWSIEDLTAEGIRKAVRTAPAKARELREVLRAERAAEGGEPEGEAA